MSEATGTAINETDHQADPFSLNLARQLMSFLESENQQLETEYNNTVAVHVKTIAVLLHDVLSILLRITVVRSTLQEEYYTANSTTTTQSNRDYMTQS